MHRRKPNSLPRDVRATAAQWVVRRDRGLTPGEAAEFECWLASAPQHAEAYRRAAAVWNVLGKVPAEIAEPIANSTLCGTPVRWFWPAFGACAAAAALVLGAFLHSPPVPVPAPAAAVAQAAPRAVRQQVLSDGTVVRLNSDAEVAEEFTPAERSVRLLRGEAFFTVTKNPRRPFVVYANGVTVRAVGTAFNVNLNDHVVDVLVEEGVVQVKHHGRVPPATMQPATAPAVDSTAPLVAAGHRATVRLVAAAATVAAPEIEVSAVDPQALATALAWREPLLNLGGATLADVALQFRQATGHTMTFGDPELAGLRIGGRFPSDDPDGFVRVLEENYGIVSHRSADGTLVLERRRGAGR